MGLAAVNHVPAPIRSMLLGSFVQVLLSLKIAFLAPWTSTSAITWPFFFVPLSELLLDAYLHIMLLLQRGYVNQTSCSQLSLENPSLGTDGSRQTPFFRRFGAHADENRFNHIREKECDDNPSSLNKP